MPTFDEIDAEIVATRERIWNQWTGPRVGDYCIMADGRVERFTHDHGDSIQTTWWTHFPNDGSWYFGAAYVSYSGALDSAIPKHKLIDTGEQREGRFWIFHHDRARAHNGVSFTIPCRVFKVF